MHLWGVKLGQQVQILVSRFLNKTTSLQVYNSLKLEHIWCINGMECMEKGLECLLSWLMDDGHKGLRPHNQNPLNIASKAPKNT